MGYLVIVKAKLDKESRVAHRITTFSYLPGFDPGRPGLPCEGSRLNAKDYSRQQRGRVITRSTKDLRRRGPESPVVDHAMV